MKCLFNLSTATRDPLFASEYISSETNTEDKSVRLPNLYSNAGSGFTKISNLSFPIVNFTTVTFESAI